VAGFPRGKQLTVIEVKSGFQKASLSGVELFAKEFPVSKKLLIGAHVLPLENFFNQSPQSLL